MPSMEQIRQEAGMLAGLVRGDDNWRGGGILGEMIARLPAWARNEFGLSPAGPAGAAGGAPGVGGAGTLPGAAPLPGTYSAGSGGIPGTTGTGTSLANLLESISGQVGNLGPIIQGITGAENQALRSQYPSEYFGALDTVLGNVGRRAQGDIQDLLPQLTQGAAEWGIGSGVGTNSPAFSSKLTRDVLGSAYNVQRQAAQDLAGSVQSAIPRVAPYSPNRLIPDIGQQLNLQALADMLRAAPIPEAAFQRNLQLAMAGLNRGFGAGGGGVQGGFNLPAPNLQPVREIIRDNFGFGGGGPPAQAPVGPGWGMAWNPQGGFAMEGNVPQDILAQEGFNPDLTGPEWDQFFDLGIEEPFVQEEEAWWL